MTQAELVLSRFGTIPKMVEQTGLPATTIRNAINRGHFPEWQRRKILDGAAAHGVPHTAFDYIAYLVERPAADSESDAPCVRSSADAGATAQETAHG